MKKMLGDIITLHKCTKNHDHMLHCSWDMAHDGFNVVSHFGLFWANFKKMIKYLEILSFYTSVPKIMIRWCKLAEIWCAKDRQTDEKSDS